MIDERHDSFITVMREVLSALNNGAKLVNLFQAGSQSPKFVVSIRNRTDLKTAVLRFKFKKGGAQ